MASLSSVQNSPARIREGSAAVEFALIGPVLIALLLAAVVYGGWFLLAQSVQSLASESARAALGGLDARERAALAQAEANAHDRSIARDHLVTHAVGKGLHKYHGHRENRLRDACRQAQSQQLTGQLLVGNQIGSVEVHNIFHSPELRNA